MKEDCEIKIGEEFKPSLQLKKLYYIYLALGIIFILACYIPMLFIVQFAVSSVTAILILFTVSCAFFWISKYYTTIIYKVTETEITWERGVWFKNMGIVPYDKITNIDITQGPILKKLGIAILQIQTAGYSGPQAKPEVKIEGIKRFKELKETIMRFINDKKTAPAKICNEDINLKIFNEIVKIRELLEKSSEK